jgi:hypothetical protein
MVNCFGNEQLKVFADQHRLRTVLNESGERIVPGKRNTGSHLFYYGNELGDTDPRTIGVLFMPDPHGKRSPAVRRLE